MSNYLIMQQHGLSKTAVASYEALLEIGGADVNSLAKRLEKSPHGLYRLLKQLEAKGFIKSIKAQPYVTYLYAELLEKALGNHAKYQRLLMRGLIAEQKQVMAERSPRPSL